MATRCPRPWACRAGRLGRLGRWLSRASTMRRPSSAPALRRLLKIASSAAVPACAIEFQDQHARARAYGHCEPRAKEATSRSVPRFGSVLRKAR
jgi:hypothetical protein